MSLRIARDLPAALDDDAVRSLQAEVLQFWRNSLLPHFRTECECLLTRLVRHVPEGDAMIERIEADHLHFNRLLVAIADGADTDTTRQLLAEAGDLLRTHIRWEEDVLFETTQTTLDEAELEALSTDVAERIPEIPSRVRWPYQRRD